MENLRTGIPMVFNTAVLTLPAGLLWAVSWFAGWQNSFNKGYEHAWFGPTIYILGMLLFTAAMAYVPLAQARQASTGDWRRFYDFRIVGKLIRRHWLASVGLALLWAVASGWVLLVKLFPAFAQYVAKESATSPVRALEVSGRFYFIAALGLFPLFVLLRLAAARLYAHALCGAYQTGLITADDLGEAEWHAFRRLDLLSSRPVPRRQWYFRLARWLATRSGQLTAAGSVFLIWFSFSFLVAVSEFVCKTEWGRGWWNQPLIQLPWFDYTPNALRRAAAQAAPEPAPVPTSLAGPP